MNPGVVYFSLSDIADLLYDEGVLTKKQGQSFKTQCQVFMTRELAKAYKNRQVCKCLQPVILPHSDYFIHYSVWTSLLGLLPKTAAMPRKINYLNFMLSEPDSIHRYPTKFKGVDLICLPRRSAPTVTTLPGPLVLEKRDN